MTSENQANLNFNPLNKWHANANLIFGFVCDKCDYCISFEDCIFIKEDMAFLDSCVLLSEYAQSQGWICIDDFKFICPSCFKI